MNTERGEPVVTWTTTLQDELWAAFKAGVEAGEDGFADNEEELRITFAVHVRHRAIRARKKQEEAADA